VRNEIKFLHFDTTLKKKQKSKLADVTSDKPYNIKKLFNFELTNSEPKKIIKE
jgi:hypothetical protein